MKKLLIVLVVLLAACSGGGEPQPVATVTERVTIIEREAAPESTPGPAPVQPEVNVSEAVFLEVLNKNGISTTGIESTMLQLGDEICTAFETGASFMEVLGVLMDSGFTDEQSGTIMGAAVGALCPHVKDDVEQTVPNA